MFGVSSNSILILWLDWFFELSIFFFNVDQAHYRAAKASSSLNLLNEAKSFCEKGLEQDPDNKELKKLAVEIDSRKREQEAREAQVSKAVGEAKV